jgi:hypothetical protein
MSQGLIHGQLENEDVHKKLRNMMIKSSNPSR